MVHARLTQLLDSLAKRAGQTLDLSEWIGYFVLDVMGDFAFGGIYEFLKRGADYNGVHELMIKFTHVEEFFGTTPWTRALFNIASSSQATEMKRISLEVAKKRMAEGSQVRDLVYYLVQSPPFPQLWSLLA